MGMLVREHICICGNNEDYKFYDGCLGYEALVCEKCGRYWDHFGQHNSDEWSLNYIGKVMIEDEEV